MLLLFKRQYDTERRSAHARGLYSLRTRKTFQGTETSTFRSPYRGSRDLAAASALFIVQHYHVVLPLCFPGKQKKMETFCCPTMIYTRVAVAGEQAPSTRKNSSSGVTVGDDDCSPARKIHLRNSPLTNLLLLLGFHQELTLSSTMFHPGHFKTFHAESTDRRV